MTDRNVVWVESRGERVTLDKPIRVFSIPLEVRQVSTEMALAAGLQVQWAAAEMPDGEVVEITVGAGVGSGWGLIKYKGAIYAFPVRSIFDGFLREVDRGVGVEGGAAVVPADE